jgi:lysyl-tRNA synthetase class 2
MEQTESELLALRREKLAALEKLGVAPFGAAFETSGDIARVREKFAEGASFRVAGRISAHRDMGKSHFVDLKDASGRMQIYLQTKELGPEAMEVFKLLDIGRFHRRGRNLFHDQDGRADVEAAQAGVAGEIAATVTGKMARLAGHRGAISPALP